MTTFKSSYHAVMDAMRGQEMTDYERGHDWANQGSSDVLRAIRTLEMIPEGRTIYMTVGTMVGYVTHGNRNEAIAWADETHETQHPRAYRVERTAKGWKVATIWTLADKEVA